MGDNQECESCGGRVGEYFDPENDPEYCECCDQTLCWVCWADTHLMYLR